MPAAFTFVDETNVVASGVLPKFTTELAPKFAPLSEMVKAPTGGRKKKLKQSAARIEVGMA